MSEQSQLENHSITPFLPRSVIGLDPEDVINRRTEHDFADLDVQICISIGWSDEADPAKLSKQEQADRLVFAAWTQLDAAFKGDCPETGVILPQGRLLCLQVRRQGQAVIKSLEELPEPLRCRFPDGLQLPSDLHGYAFHVAPLPSLPPDGKRVARGDRMTLNGDGMIYRLGFEQGKATLKTRIVKPPCYYADRVLEQTMKGQLCHWFFGFHDAGLSRLSLSLGNRSQLNTAFLPTRDRLLVTFDAGRPTEIDPDTLEVIEPVGTTQDWIGLVQFYPYVFQPYSNPAHPVCDVSKLKGELDELFTVNFSQGLAMVNIINRLVKWINKRLFHPVTGCFNHFRTRFKPIEKTSKEQIKQPQDKTPEEEKIQYRSRGWGSFTDLVHYRFPDSKNSAINPENYMADSAEGEAAECTIDRWRLFLPNGDSVFIEQSIHQMVITEDYIVLGDIAFKMEFSQIFAPIFFGALRKPASAIGYLVTQLFLRLVEPLPYTNLYIIRRADLKDSTLDREPDFEQGCDRFWKILIKIIKGITRARVLIRKLWPFKSDVNIPEAAQEILARSDDEKPTKRVRPLQATKVTIPREVSHFAADYQNLEDKITIHLAHNNGWDATEWIGEYDESVDREKDPQKRSLALLKWATQFVELFTRPIVNKKQKKRLRKDLKGMQAGPVDVGALAKYVIDGKTGALLEAKFVSAPGSEADLKNTWSPSVYTHRELCRDRETEQLKTIHNIYWMSWGFSWELVPRRIFKTYQGRDCRGIPPENIQEPDKPMSLLQLNTKTMKIARSFEFPIGYFARSPQFIPSQNSESAASIDPSTHSTHGYIACVVLADDPTSTPPNPKDEYWIFHADGLKDKPIYRLSCPAPNKAGLGLTIHSTWLPDLKLGQYPSELRQHKRKRSFIQDYTHLINQKSCTVQKLLWNTVYDNYCQQNPEEKTDP